MKKYAKLIALILTVFTLCTILCSCDAIDEMREQHAFYKEDGTISYKGNTYLKLPVYVKLNNDVYGQFKYVYVTEENVPVLFSRKYGVLYKITNDDVVIEGAGAIYARSDKFDQVKNEVEKMKNGDFDGLRIIYTDGYKSKIAYTFTSGEVELIKKIIGSENVPYSGGAIDIINLYYYTESGYFGGLFGTLVIRNEGKYVITDQRTAYGGRYNNYNVPEEYQKDFESIQSKISGYATVQ